jgi:hypothetical protein
MPKTITLRLKDEVYKRFLNAAVTDNRTISNMIETLALKKLEELYFVGELEMHDILNDKNLTTKLKRGSKQAKEMRGKFIE